MGAGYQQSLERSGEPVLNDRARVDLVWGAGGHSCPPGAEVAFAENQNSKLSVPVTDLGAPTNTNWLLKALLLIVPLNPET